jgi:hypothetical protein
MKHKVTVRSNVYLTLVAVFGGCAKDNNNQPTSPPPVTFALSVTSVRAAGGPEMTDDCLEVGRDRDATVIVTVDGPPANPTYLNPPGKCAVNSACGYLAVTFTPALESGVSAFTAWASTANVNVALLEQGVPLEELVGNYDVSVELRTPSHEVALDTSGQPVVVSFPLTLRLPGECGAAAAPLLDGASSEDASGDAAEDQASTADGESQNSEDAGPEPAPQNDAASEQDLADATGE